MDKVPMTNNSYNLLEEELKTLKSEDSLTLLKLLLKQENMVIYLKTLNIMQQKNNNLL